MKIVVLAALLSFISITAQAEKLVEVSSNARTNTRYMIDIDSVSMNKRKTSFFADMHSYSTAGVHTVSTISVDREACESEAGTLYMMDDTKKLLEFAWSLDSFNGNGTTVSDAVAVSLCIMGNGNWDKWKTKKLQS